MTIQDGYIDYYSWEKISIVYPETSGEETNAKQQLEVLFPEKTIKWETAGEAELSLIIVEENNSSDPNKDQAHTIEVNEEGVIVEEH